MNPCWQIYITLRSFIDSIAVAAAQLQSYRKTKKKPHKKDINKTFHEKKDQKVKQDHRSKSTKKTFLYKNPFYLTKKTHEKINTTTTKKENLN